MSGNTSLPNGTVVRGVLRRVGKGDYTPEAIAQRLRNDSRVGVIEDRSDGHGLCYKVVFHDDEAWFDWEELTVIPDARLPYMRAG